MSDSTLQPYVTWTDLIGIVHFLVFDNVLKEEWVEGSTVTEHPVEFGPDIADHIRVNLDKCTLTIRSTNEPIGLSSASSGIKADSGDTPLTGPLSVPIVSALFGPSAAQTIIYPEWVNPITLRALLQGASGLTGELVGGDTGNLIGALAGSALAALLFPATMQTDIQQNTLGLPNVLNAPATFTTQQWPAGTDYVGEMHRMLQSLKNDATLFSVAGSKQTADNMAIESLTFTRSSETGTGEDIEIGFKQINIVTTQTVTVPILSLPAPKAVTIGAQTPTPATPAQVKQSLLAAAAATPTGKAVIEYVTGQ
jgi:hypothetical protein